MALIYGIDYEYEQPHNPRRQCHAREKDKRLTAAGYSYSIYQCVDTTTVVFLGADGEELIRVCSYHLFKRLFWQNHGALT